MEYLFFDIECANNFGGCGKICEFGYVVTDENFEIKEKDIILVNPKAQFDWYVLKKMLAYRRRDYEKAPSYPKVYPRIRALFDRPDVLVVGHTVDADAKYLNDESARYGLPFIDYKFYDAMRMYSDYANLDRNVALESIGETLGSAVPAHAHRSLDDAEATAMIVKEMCARLGVGLSELIARCDDCSGETVCGEITTVVREQARLRRLEKAREKNMLRGDKYRQFVRFTYRVKPSCEVVPCVLTGKTLCLSNNYQNYHCRESFGLVRVLRDRGCRYTVKAEECDCFVPYTMVGPDGTERKCKKLSIVMDARARGKDIEIIEFPKLLEMLGVTEEELAERSSRPAKKAEKVPV